MTSSVPHSGKPPWLYADSCRYHSPGSQVLWHKGPRAPSITICLTLFTIFILLQLIFKMGARRTCDLKKGQHCFEGFVFHSKDGKRKRDFLPKLFIWKISNLQKSCKNNTMEHMPFQQPRQVFTSGNICSLSLSHVLFLF